VATAGADADARIWDVATGGHYALQRRAFGPLREIALDPTGHWAAGAAPISVIAWNAVSGRQLFYVRGHTALVQSVAFAPAGETILSASADGTVRTYTCEVCVAGNGLLQLAKIRLAQTR
jgi:WD40 repeat protein